MLLLLQQNLLLAPVVLPVQQTVHGYGGGGGYLVGGSHLSRRDQELRRFYNKEKSRFEIPIEFADQSEQDDEEAIIIAILLQVAHEIH